MTIQKAKEIITKIISLDINYCDKCGQAFADNWSEEYDE